MKIKAFELTGTALDWAVAKCVGEQVRLIKGQLETSWTDKGWKPSTEWSQGGPIIDRENISVMRVYKDWQEPWCADMHEQSFVNAATPLVAAMRSYVGFKLGAEVDVPDELVQQNHENPTNP